MPSFNCPIETCTYKTPHGDDAVIVALLNIHTQFHIQESDRLKKQQESDRLKKQPISKAEKIKRPTFTSKCTSKRWLYDISKWNTYKKHLSEKEIVPQLLEACEESLRVDIFRTKGDLANERATEEQVIEYIKEHTVKMENLTVSRKKLLETKQDRDEPVGAFIGRLKGLASMCDLKVTAPCASENCSHSNTSSYLDDIVRFVLVTGLADMDIQAEVLGHTKQNMTLDELTQFIEAKEAGKSSSSSLAGTQATCATQSSYRRYSNQPQKPAMPPTTTDGRQNHPYQHNARPTTTHDSNHPHCGCCGTRSHRNYSKGEKRTLCPAYTKTCSNCRWRGHFSKMCKQKRRYQTTSTVEHTLATTPTSEHEEDEGPTFLSAFASTNYE